MGMVELWGWLDSFSFQVFRRASEGVVSGGAVLVKKPLRDLSRLGAGTWPCRGASHLWLACTALPCWPLLFWWGNTWQDVQVVGVSGLQAPSDASAALVKSRVQFFCMGGSLPPWAGILCSRAAEGEGCGTECLGTCTPSGVGESAQDVVAGTYISSSGMKR